jgi:hypothetical protein
MARIFISHSRADRQFVDDLVPLLHRVYGQDSLWYDDDIHGGADWWQLILSEIAACELFIYLISNDSLASPYCQAEFREALRLRKQVLPVIVRPKTDYPGVVADDLKQILRDIQYVDMARGVKDTNTLTLLYASANRLLAQVPSQPQTPQTAQPVSPPPVPDRPQKQPAPVFWVIGTVVAMLVIGAIVTALASGGEDGHKATPEAPETLIAAVDIQAATPAPSSTETKSSTYQPTPTVLPETGSGDGKTANAQPTYTPTPTPSFTPTEVRPTADERVHLVIQRSGDTVAVCTDKMTDLSTLWFDFGHGWRYMLGDHLVKSAQTLAGQCWCLQLETPRFPVPTLCQDHNTSRQYAAGSARDVWRNGTLTLTLDNKQVGTCKAQPDNLGVYQCELMLSED